MNFFFLLETTQAEELERERLKGEKVRKREKEQDEGEIVREREGRRNILKRGRKWETRERELIKKFVAILVLPFHSIRQFVR